MKKPVKMTPMLQQYLEIKEQYQETILFYRMGDFYEMFFQDAVTASKVLGITLTSRSKKDENQVPMCGVPFHAVSGYLSKMVKAGYRVAICEQTEDPKQAKGIVKREVVRVVTPGVTTDDQILDEKSNHYVCALVLREISMTVTAGLSFFDISTGDFQISEPTVTASSFDAVIDEITRMQPSELLVEEASINNFTTLFSTLSTLISSLCITRRPDFSFEYQNAFNVLTEHFKTSNLAGFGCQSMQTGIQAAGGLLFYIQETQKTDLSFIQKLSPFNNDNFLKIDESSRRNLELVETIIGGKRKGSLLSILDLTCTPMGARLLKKRLLFPLQDRQRIRNRLNSVKDLLADNGLKIELRENLDSIYDLERLCSRLVLGHGNARDMSALKFSLAKLPALQSSCLSAPPGLLQSIGSELDLLEEIFTLIDKAIRDDAHITIKDGNLIKEGYHQELDRLTRLEKNSKQMILELEQQEREQTGISKLKIGYNRVFGYYFELNRSLAANVPEYFIRKQTLLNAERFITPALKELENEISSAWEKRLELEFNLFIEIRNKIAAQSQAILSAAKQIARIDFLVCLAEAAARYHYCMPRITDDNTIDIIEGRHPVIERAMESGRFVPNDIFLDQEKQELLIITGPNMAGKSTVLRQTALIVLMAHIGSFVPADKAEICIVDRIFTRVGAMDDLRRGQSTFMVEMNETANILNNATEHSLIILDEIGRGTSTYDGLSIAWAVAEELASKNQIGIKTLFATHYHELTDLAATNKRIKNFSIAVREWNDSIIFLHKLVEGGTNRSYGIQVASLAGVPHHVIARAHEILKNIEEKEYRQDGLPSIIGPTQKRISNQPQQMSLFQKEIDPVRKLLKDINPNKTSPLDALQLLYQLHELNNRC
jgi:DNA mismatch repair protein MutS